MKIKDIPKDKCGICPLIDLCGDAFEDPHLCFCSSIENMSVKEYIDMAEKTEVTQGMGERLSMHPSLCFMQDL